MPHFSRAALVLVGLVSLSACNEGVSNKSRIPAGKRLGDTCTDSGADACRLGLKCDGATHTCVGGASFGNGEACIIGSECESGYCAANGNKGVCSAGGTVAKGGTCEGDGDCVAGLKCSFDGATMFPRCVTAGVLDVGGACTNNGQCAQGLFCSSEKCTFISMDPSSPLLAHGYPPILPNPTARWQGASCPSESGPATALWELPRGADGDGVKQDFYRLPFPNDARRAPDGSLDFSRFPKDPAPPFGFDAMGRYLEALKKEPFSNYGATIFRFSAEVTFSGFSAQGTNPQLRLVDLTQGTRFGNRRGLFFQYSPGRNRYVCESWVSVRPYTGDVMLPGTYAVILLKGLTDAQGAQFQSAPDFQAMLSGTAPSDAVQAAAWPAYAPLRQYLTAQSINTADVLSASVFSVGDGQRLSRSLADSVAALPVPTADAWVKCGSGTPSPCPDTTGARACGNSTAFDEFHALIELPIFQQGTAPYLSPAEGGSISAAGGVLTPVRKEKVCASLTAPKGAAPAGGWPLAVYAHGTGGSYRSHAEDGAGAALSQAAVDGGTADGGTLPGGYALLGFDQVGHGPRRGARTDVSPDDIVFNFGNPASARGTMAQGGADLLSVALYAKGLGTSAPSPLPALDTTHLVFWGHSQGATEGGLALANDRVFEGALLSGASASITDALLSKKAPVNIADSMWIALSESSSSAVNAFHPAMTLFQMWIDPSDPINHAKDVAVVPARGTAPVFARHVFQVWGKGDLFTARPVQTAFGLAAGLQLVLPKIEVEFEPAGVSAVQGNISTPRAVTAAVRQYQPATAYDGHFVVFRDPGAQRDAVRFLVRAASGDVPRIPEP
jgi:hypothetical protein